jgi:N-acetylneuraminic acid mutarotase
MIVSKQLLMSLSKRIHKITLQQKILFGLCIFLITLLKPSITYADFLAPSWWNGDQCDSTHYTSINVGDIPVLLTTWLGVQTCGYGPNQTPSWPDVPIYMPGSSVAEYEWECTELVKRYLYLAYGTPALSGTNGDQVVTNYANQYPDIYRSVNNADGSNTINHIWPKVGDVLSYSDVHTAVITGVAVTDQANGNAVLTLIEQNASQSGTTTQKFINWKIKGDIDDPNANGSDAVTAWLNPIMSYSRTWTPSNDQLPNSVVYHTASLLSNGNVLVAGGERNGSPVQQSYLYSPSTKSWSYTGNMSTGRRYHTANLVTISGGSTKVLVTGGSTPSGITASTQLYDPSTGTWSSGANMHFARALHSSTTLNDGTVFIVGGQASLGITGATASAELYDPINNTWTNKANLNKARWNHTATLIGDGKVLITGGSTSPSGVATSSAEIYNPANDSWTMISPMSNARAGHTATLLSNGKVLIAGGVSTGGTYTKTTEIFDPSTNTFSNAATMNYIHGFSYSGTANLITLHDGITKNVLISGGTCGSSDANRTELYDYDTNSWTITANMNQRRCYATATTLNDGTILDIGSGSFTGAGTNTSEYYTP